MYEQGRKAKFNDDDHDVCRRVAAAEEAPKKAAKADSTRRTISPKFIRVIPKHLKRTEDKCKIIAAYDNVSSTVSAAREETEKVGKSDCNRRTVSPKIFQSIPIFLKGRQKNVSKYSHV